MRPLAPILLGLTLCTPAAGQVRRNDSLEVIAVVQRFHAALEAGDTTAGLTLLAPSAVILERGGIRPLAEYRGEGLAGEVRFAQAIERRAGPIQVRLLGPTAWAYSLSHVQARARPDLINGRVAELIVLTRSGQTWWIEAIHSSSGSAEP